MMKDHISNQEKKLVELHEGIQIVDRDRQLKKIIDKELKLKKRLTQHQYKSDLVR